MSFLAWEALAFVVPPEARLRAFEYNPQAAAHQVTTAYGLGLQTGCSGKADTASYRTPEIPGDLTPFLISGNGRWKVVGMSFTVSEERGEHWLSVDSSVVPASPLAKLLLGRRVIPTDAVIGVMATC